MIVRFEQIYNHIQRIEKEIEELKRLKGRIPEPRRYSAALQIAFDQAISDLQNEKISLEELEIENPPADLISDVLSVDMATASRIRVDREVVPVEPTAAEKTLIEFLRAIPKTEIHLHMEACISRFTLAGMLDHHGTPYEIEELDKLYKFTNLQEFIKLFLYIIDSIKTPDDFGLIFKNLRSYLENNSIRYAEVFLAPSRMLQNGLNFQEIAQTLDALSRECRLSGGPDVRYLIDVSRTFGPENASRNLQHVLTSKVNSIIGIGLGGAELMGPARDYRHVFDQAHAEGLHTVAHAGEDDGPWSIRDTVELLKAERIGHGTSAIQDPELIDLLRDRAIPIEICLTSNIFTGKYVRREQDHPVRRYYDQGLICTVNTDDPEIFNVDLTQEYYKFYRHLNFSVSEIVDLVRQGVYASFHPKAQDLWHEFRPEIDRLRKKFSV
jgi:adenosine deaminase